MPLRNRPSPLLLHRTHLPEQCLFLRFLYPQVARPSQPLLAACSFCLHQLVCHAGRFVCCRSCVRRLSHLREAQSAGTGIGLGQEIDLDETSRRWSHPGLACVCGACARELWNKVQVRRRGDKKSKARDAAHVVSPAPVCCRAVDRAPLSFFHPFLCLSSHPAYSHAQDGLLGYCKGSHECCALQDFVVGTASDDFSHASPSSLLPGPLRTSSGCPGPFHFGSGQQGHCPGHVHS